MNLFKRLDRQMSKEIVFETHRDPHIVELAKKANAVIKAAEELDAAIDKAEDDSVPRWVYNDLLSNFQRIYKENEDLKARLISLLTQ